jgi:hypothetical protein
MLVKTFSIFARKKASGLTQRARSHFAEARSRYADINYWLKAYWYRPLADGRCGRRPAGGGKAVAMMGKTTDFIGFFLLDMGLLRK